MTVYFFIKIFRIEWYLRTIIVINVINILITLIVIIYINKVFDLCFDISQNLMSSS